MTLTRAAASSPKTHAPRGGAPAAGPGSSHTGPAAPSFTDRPFGCPLDKPKRGGRGAKRKGSAFELEIVKFLQEQGIAAEKVPLSGAVKRPGFDRDITVPVQGVDQPAECKRRKRAFATIEKMLGSNFCVFIRDDRSRPMVVMDLITFARLAR